MHQMEAQLRKATAKHKKYKMTFNYPDGSHKSISFGDNRYQDFTQHHDKERQKKYLQRHAKDPRTMTSAGELSRVILWSSPSLDQGIKNYEQKHNIKINVKKL